MAADRGSAVLDAFAEGLLKETTAVEAAVYDRRTDDDGVEYFLSPTAGRLMGSRLRRLGATECEPPGDLAGLDLVAGDRSKAESP